MSTRISLITVCRNPGAHLRAAVESVLAQTYGDIEYILVDGGSTDGTVEYLRSIQDRVASFISEPDAGAYDALNKGIRRATGDVIGLLHADDLLAGPSVIAEIAEAFEATAADVVYGDLVYVSQRDPSRVVRYWKAGPFDRSRLRFGWMPPHPTFYARRSVYERARLSGGEYFDTGMRIASDYDFMLRVLSEPALSVVYLPRILVRMRMGGASNRSLGNLVRKSLEDLTAIRRNHIGRLGTLLAKNVRKLPQFVLRQRKSQPAPPKDPTTREFMEDSNARSDR